MLGDKEEIIFAQTAAKAEQAANNNLLMYKVRLVLFALLGHGVIFLTLLSLFGLVGGLIGMAFVSTSFLVILLFKSKVLLLVFPLIWVFLKSLWIRFEDPQGYMITEKEAPALFKELELLRKTLNTPKVHQVILTPELNASISQIPRLGIFGWKKNTLTLGLELLLLLSPEQARAVIAHELGHLSANHSKFNSWVYRVRISWLNIMQAFHDEDSWGASLMRKFFNWYAPRFAAYSFVLARDNEYEADAISALLTSPKDAGEALVNVYVTGPYINANYWDVFFKQADVISKPTHGPWSGLHNFLGQYQLAENKLKQMFHDELEIKTTYQDTHPSLSDRISALAVSAELPEQVRQSAAYVWFGEQYDKIINDFDQEWVELCMPRWDERYHYVLESKKKLSELSAMEEVLLSDNELWQKARLTEEFESELASLPIFKAYWTKNPNDPDVNFVLGRILYDQDDEGMLQYMKASLSSRNLVYDACEYAYYFLTNHHRQSEALWWKEKAEEQLMIDEESRKERSELNLKDEFIPTTVSEKIKQQIITELKKHPKVKAAWLAEKKVVHYSEEPLLTIVVRLRGIFTKQEKEAAVILEALDLEVTFFVIPITKGYKRMTRKMIKVGEKII